MGTGTAFAGSAVGDLRSACMYVLEGNTAKTSLHLNGCQCHMSGLCSN